MTEGAPTQAANDVFITGEVSPSETTTTPTSLSTTGADSRVDGILRVRGIEDLAPEEQASYERLDSEVTEPDDAVFFGLDEQEDRRDVKATRHSWLHALVVLVTDRVAPGDQSGELVAELLAEEDFMVDAVLTVESSRSSVRQALETAVVGGADIVITVGGTGVGPRDQTPEATKAVLDKRIPGLSQSLRASALACNALDGGLSRGVAGVSGSTVVVNLASSRAAIRDGMATLCPLARHIIGELNQA